MSCRVDDRVVQIAVDGDEVACQARRQWIVVGVRVAGGVTVADRVRGDTPDADGDLVAPGVGNGDVGGRVSPGGRDVAELSWAVMGGCPHADWARVRIPVRRCSAAIRRRYRRWRTQHQPNSPPVSPAGSPNRPEAGHWVYPTVDWPSPTRAGCQLFGSCWSSAPVEVIVPMSLSGGVRPICRRVATGPDGADTAKRIRQEPDSGRRIYGNP
jgi:hypothetical protein